MEELSLIYNDYLKLSALRNYSGKCERAPHALSRDLEEALREYSRSQGR